jgi:predicted TIM-barrel fold metal-dependent hydrolase
MGTSRCWQDNVINGFRQKINKTTVAQRKKIKRMAVRMKVKELKAAGKHVDLQAINKEVVDMFRRRKQSQRPKHKV